MQVFLFNIANSRLRRYSSGVIYEGTHPNTVFKFNFNTSDWSTSKEKNAVFSFRGKNYRESLDENNMCRVPKEVLDEGYFLMSVEGENGFLTNSVRIPVAENPNGDTTPDADDKPESNEVNIFDGGAIVSVVSDEPDDDKPDVPDAPSTPEEDSIVGYIMKHKIPCYVGVVGEEPSEVAYADLNTSSANYTDQGFYTTTNHGDVTHAGYQMTFEGNEDGIAQTFSMYSNAKIIAAYQYHVAFNQWMDVGFDGTYWVEDGTMTKTINGQQVAYTTYAYNVELMGDAITATEYWRFEVEVS